MSTTTNGEITGGLGVAKMFGNFSGALMVLPVLLVTACWLRILKEEGGFALRYCSKPTPEEEMAGAPVPPHFSRMVHHDSGMPR